MGLFDKAKDALGKAAQAVADVCNSPDEGENATPAKDEAAQNRTGNANRQEQFAVRITRGLQNGVATITGAKKREEEKLAADRAAREAREAERAAEEAQKKAKREEARKICEAEGHDSLVCVPYFRSRSSSDDREMNWFQDFLYKTIDHNGCEKGFCRRCFEHHLIGKKVVEFSAEEFPLPVYRCPVIQNVNGEQKSVGFFSVNIDSERSTYMISNRKTVHFDIGELFVYIAFKEGTFNRDYDFPLGAEVEWGFVCEDADGQILDETMCDELISAEHTGDVLQSEYKLDINSHLILNLGKNFRRLKLVARVVE